MNKKKNKKNLTLTVCGVLGICSVANAQQVKQESPVEVTVSTLFKQSQPEVKKVEGKKPEVKPLEVKKVEERKPEVKPLEVKKVEERKSEVKPLEVKKVEERKPEVNPLEVKKVDEKKPEVNPEVKKLEKITINKSFTERTQLVEKYNKSKGLIIGVFPGSVGSVDATTHMGRYLPFVNLLTVGTSELVSFAPEWDHKSLKNKAAKGKYDLLYVYADIASIAVKNGYEPLVQRSEKYISVLLTKKESTISSIKDLGSAKVGESPQSLISILARAKFKTDNIVVNYTKSTLTGQSELVVGLDNGVFDAVVVRKEAADEAMSKNPNKYKIAFVIDEAPGQIVLAKKELSSSFKDNLVKSLISLNPENTNDKALLSSLDGKAGGFSKIDLKEIEVVENKIKITE